MAVSREQKAVQLKELKEKFQTASSVIFAHYIGMTVTDASDLRKKLKGQGAEMKVAKKTLMAIAAKEAALPVMEEDKLDGPVACIFSFQDPLSGAQVAFKFSKDHPQITFLGGMFEGKLLSKQEAMALATIPSRQVLLAIFAGMIRSPLTKFASMCNNPLTGFARALKELEKKGGANPEAAAPAAPAAAESPAAPTTSAADESIANVNAIQRDATGDPVDPSTGGRTEVVLAEDLKEESHALTETDAEAAPEGSAAA